MSKLLGRYHFAGPYKCRPLNVYADAEFDADEAADRFGYVIANRLLGSAYEGNWRPYGYGLQPDGEWWEFEMVIVRRDPKIPSRATPRHVFKGSITYVPA